MHIYFFINLCFLSKFSSRHVECTLGNHSKVLSKKMPEKITQFFSSFTFPKNCSSGHGERNFENFAEYMWHVVRSFSAQITREKNFEIFKERLFSSQCSSGHDENSLNNPAFLNFTTPNLEKLFLH